MSTPVGAKVYTPAELYELAKSKGDLSKDLDLIYHQIQETNFEEWGYNETRDNKLVEIFTIKDFCFDGRRTWSLRTVWFNGEPVMITQNAGREGYDCIRRFITNLSLFNEMIIYIISLQIRDEIDEPIWELYQPAPELTEFYKQNLDGYFEHY